jgi:hypothetical protein
MIERRLHAPETSAGEDGAFQTGSGTLGCVTADRIQKQCNKNQQGERNKFSHNFG